MLTIPNVYRYSALLVYDDGRLDCTREMPRSALETYLSVALPHGVRYAVPLRRGAGLEWQDAAGEWRSAETVFSVPRPMIAAFRQRRAALGGRAA